MDKKTILFFPTSVAPAREMALLAQEAQKKRGYLPQFIVFRAGLMEHLQNWKIITLGFKNKLAQTHDGEPSNSNFIKPLKHIKSGLSFWIKKFFLLNILPFQILRFFKHRIRLARELKIANELLTQIKPQAVFFTGDRSVYWEIPFLKICAEKKILAIIPPLALSDSESCVPNREKKREHELDLWHTPFLNRWVAKKYPNQVYRSTQNHRTYLFFPPEQTLALAELNLLPENPWGLGGGLSTLICVEGENSKTRILHDRISEKKIRVTGHPSHDFIFRSLQNRDQDRKKIFDLFSESNAHSNSLDESFLILFTPPQLWEHGVRTEEEHWSEIRFLARHLAEVTHTAREGRSQRIKIGVTLHPKSIREHYLFLEKEYGFKIIDTPLREVLPACDLYVATYSSTVEWALLCGIPSLVVDFYGWNLNIYDAYQGVIKLTDREKLKPTLESFFGSQITQENLKKSAQTDQKKIATFDGKASERVLSLLDEVIF